MEEKKILVAKPASPFKKYMKRIPFALGLLIVINVLALLFIAYNTRMEYTIMYINSTNPAQVSWFPPEQVPPGFEAKSRWDNTYDSKSPSGSFSWGWAIALCIFNLISMHLIITRVSEKPTIKSQEALNIFKEWWENANLHNNGKYGELIYDDPQIWLKRDKIGETIFLTWIIPAERLKDGAYSYILGAIDGYTGDIVGRTKSTKEFSRVDQCPNCGDYSWVRTITDEELKRSLALIKSTRGGSQ